jgi:TRCF domain
MNQRLMLYKKFAGARRDEDIDRALDEAADRYGPLPESVLNLADYARIRVMADRLGLESIDREGRLVVLKFRPQAKVDPVRLVALVRQRQELTLVPPAALKLNLDRAEGRGMRDESSRRLVIPRPSSLIPGQRRARSDAAAPSWWTARALAGDVKPGFNKEEMTRTAQENPRAPGGLFERVGGLLSELVDQG